MLALANAASLLLVISSVHAQKVEARLSNIEFSNVFGQSNEAQEVRKNDRHDVVEDRQNNAAERVLMQGSVPNSADGSCGGSAGRKCPTGQCCSQYGYCGTTSAYCGTGCQKAYGACSTSCPPGWSRAVGTVYDSWPKPGTNECINYSGCKWAGMFSQIPSSTSKSTCNTDGSCCKNFCKTGAQMLSGGSGAGVCCRWPEAKVKSWRMAATYDKFPALKGRKLQVMVEGRDKVNVTVNVLDVCNDGDCDGCCSDNTGAGRWKLIDMEKWPASALLGFSTASPSFDLGNVAVPTVTSLRKSGVLTSRAGAPEDSVIPLCYKDIGVADPPV